MSTVSTPSANVADSPQLQRIRAWQGFDQKAWIQNEKGYSAASIPEYLASDTNTPVDVVTEIRRKWYDELEPGLRGTGIQRALWPDGQSESPYELQGVNLGRVLGGRSLAGFPISYFGEDVDDSEGAGGYEANDFEWPRLYGVTLENVYWPYGLWRAARLYNVRIRNCEMVGSIFDQWRAYDLRIENSNLSLCGFSPNWYPYRWRVKDTLMQDCRFGDGYNAGNYGSGGGYFVDGRFENVDFSGSRFDSWFVLNRSVFRNCKFNHITNQDAENLDLGEGVYINCDFQEAQTPIVINFQNGQMVGCDFTKANMTGNSNAAQNLFNLRDCNFTRATIQDPEFGGDVVNTSFRDVDFTDRVQINNNLTDMRGTTFEGSNIDQFLTRQELRNELWYWDETTRWVDGQPL